MKNLIKILFSTACRVFGFGLGILGIIFLFSWITPQQAPQLLTNTQSIIEPNHDNSRALYNHNKPTILKINIKGMIGSDTLNASSFRLQIMEAMEQLKTTKVKALLLAINSTGGTVHDSESIYQQILHFKEQYNIPVFAFSDGFLASGAYYIASAADVIITTPQTWTGSIGVVMPTFFNIHQLLDSWKIKTENISAGKGKDMLNPTRPWTDSESTSVANLVNYLYDQFVSVVDKSRDNLDKETIKNTLGANIFHSDDALKYNLIDQTALSEQDVLWKISSILEIQDNYQVISFPIKNFFSQIFSYFDQQPKESLNLGVDSYIPEKFKNRYRGQFLYIYE